MKNTLGTSITVTLFGESHGTAIGAVLDGLTPGLTVNENFIRHQLMLRRPQDALSTSRQEPDPFQLVSGIFEGKTTGTPLCILISNTDTHSRDYGELRTQARPGHADYTAYCKYHGYADYRGGGHFSGRLTAPLVAAGAIVIPALAEKGIYIGTHILRCHGVSDRVFGDYADDIAVLGDAAFPVLDPDAAEKMKKEILSAREQQDSVGGILQTAVIGLPAGVGEPWFDTLEGTLAQALFSIPAFKGVEFGSGFAFSDLTGSEANDSFFADKSVITTTTNHNGGINGGISNGMPVVFQCAVKPTPSIAKTQDSVDFVKTKNISLSIHGRHDPAVIHRARIVVDSLTALVLADLLAQRFGTDWLGGQG